MDDKTSSVVGAIALNAIFGNEPKFSHTLIDALGSAGAVFRLSEQERLELFGPYNARAAQITPAALEAAHTGIQVLIQATRGLDSFYAERSGLIVGY